MTLEKLVVIIQAETAALEKGINRVKSQLSSLESQASKVSGAISGAFNRASSGMNKAFKALSLGALMAGLVGFGKTALDSASDLQEWQNVVQVAFGDAITEVEKFNSMAVSRFGLSGIAARKLTGTFMAMADGIGLSNEAGAKMAIQLAGLSADMASFFNTTTDQTSNALEGIFTNQTRALKQYGIVMTEANLEAFRMARGIQTAYSDMNEAQRVALRYNYVLAATANAQNDFARTSMSWANQMRQLQMNWQTLTSTVGAQLINILTPVVAILNKILKLAISVINAIAKIFGGTGIKGLSTALGDAGGAAGGLADNIGDVGDGLGGANKAAKKFKATIAGFDELEVLNSQPTSGGGGGGGSGGGGGGGGAGAEDLDSYFDLYEEEGLLGDFEDFFQKIKDMMDADNWEGVGAEIGKGLNKVFQVIDDFITNKLEPFGVLWASRIARVLNGLIDEVDWDLIGKTFADGLNAYIHIANEFYETFNALNFAVGIATAINSWFRNVDWDGLGAYLANKLNFLGDMLYGFATTIDWEQIKNSIQTALSSLFEKLDVEKIKVSIQQLINDALDFLKSVDWYEIGHTVGEMLSGVDWLGVFKSVKDDVIWPAFKGFWDGLMSDGKNLLIGTLGKVGSWFKESFWGPFAAAAFGAVGTNIMIGAVRGFFTGKDSFIGEIARSALYVAGQIPVIGKPFEKAWKTLTEMMQIKGEFKFTFFEAIQTYLDSLSGGPLVALRGFVTEIGKFIFSWKGAGIITGIITALSSAYGGLGGVLERVKKAFSDAWEYAKVFFEATGAAGAVERLKEAFSKLGGALKQVYDALAGLKPVWELIFNVLSALAGIVIGVVGSVLSVVADLVGGIVTAISFIISKTSEFIDWVLSGIGNLVQGVIDFFTNMNDTTVLTTHGMWDAVEGLFGTAIDWVVNAVNGFVTTLVNFFTNLKDKAVEIYTNIKNFLSTTWNAIKENTISLWNSIKLWLTQTWENIKQKITDTWNAIKTFTSQTWESIKSTLSAIWEGIKSVISNAIGSAKSTISNAWESVKTTTSNIWNGIKSTISGIWDGIKSKAESVTGSIKSFFSNAYSNIKNTWDGFGSWFSGVFSGIGGVVRSALNGIISIMNRFSVDVPEGVPLVGGSHFGFNIPYLAKGGIITSPTVAMMGEYSGASTNPEIVAPQSLLKETIDASNGEMVSALYQIATQIISAIDGVDFSVSIGDDQIANAANRGNNAYKKRTGKPLFSM